MVRLDGLSSLQELKRCAVRKLDLKGQANKASTADDESHILLLIHQKPLLVAVEELGDLHDGDSVEVRLAGQPAIPTPTEPSDTAGFVRWLTIDSEVNSGKVMESPSTTSGRSARRLSGGLPRYDTTTPRRIGITDSENRPNRIILIRHGQSEQNVASKQGLEVASELYTSKHDSQHALTDEGRRQAHAAGVKLKQLMGTESVWFLVSPFQRTRETHAEIAKSFQDNRTYYQEDPRLREQDTGNLMDKKRFYELNDIYEYGISTIAKQLPKTVNIIQHTPDVRG